MRRRPYRSHRVSERERDRAPLLSVLETIRLASLRFWNWIVRLAPIAVFAPFAVTVGTTASRDLASMSLYLALFLLGTFLLAFWVLPAIMCVLVHQSRLR
jgi:Na+/H+-dicarboxylate symporter